MARSRTNTYKEKKDQELKVKYEELRKQLPDFVITWLNSKPNLTWSSRVAYTFDIIRYLEYVLDSVEGIKATTTRSMTLSDISDDAENASSNRFSDDFFNAYTSYLRECTDSLYSGNNRNSVERKLVPIRAIYQYYSNRGDIRLNPMANYGRFKEPDAKNIVHLSGDEVQALFEAAGHAQGVEMTAHQRAFYEKTRQRDFAIIMLLLGTGIRVSELVGADLKSVDFKSHSLAVIRKGEHSDQVYFNESVATALQEYISGERCQIKATSDEDPLFFSLQGKRISVAAVEKLVKKYTGAVTAKNITPHKLRATYGTSLYQATGDLGLVQDALGHSSPTTTKKFYVNSREENMKKAAKTELYRQDK